MKRKFSDYTEAEDFANEVVFGGDDRTVVSELVEVWRDAEHFDSGRRSDDPEAWGDLYAVWGTEAEVDAEIAKLGEFIDTKGRTGWPDALPAPAERQRHTWAILAYGDPT